MEEPPAPYETEPKKDQNGIPVILKQTTENPCDKKTDDSAHTHPPSLDSASLDFHNARRYGPKWHELPGR